MLKFLPIVALSVILDGGNPIDNVGLVTVHKPGQAPSITGGEDCSGSLTLVPRHLRNGRTAHSVKQGEVLGFRFQGVAGEHGSLSFSAPSDSPLGVTTASAKWATLTDCAGKFTDIGANCQRTGVNGSITYLFGTSDGSPRCFLNPATTYFLSIRNYAAGSDSCPEGTVCGTVLNVNRVTP